MSATALPLAGAVTLATYVAQRARLDSVAAAGAVDVDWQAVDAVDSSAVSLILHGRRLAAASGTRIEHRNLPPALDALAALYGVSDLIAA